ncbi:TonB-dependent receptor [Solitalea koreensis]|uniref:Outer membrane receptor proteins, mostly Fe transport n=1 Tax=Solitalea koreensis TaxID=543615 RepID=A0A521E527_9SPHI|nr:TonB-dependent receptor [Solitalea koreensis]SMO79017.1 Outer membrane receptor proteins, mostly Fe transport [Solitalea koreensis]
MKQFYSKLWTAVLLLMIVFQFSAFAQNAVTISGNVKDKLTNEPLPGVSINVKGKVTGTTTDIKGNFSLKTNTTSAFTITVAYIGYKPQEIVISGSQIGLSIAMEAEAILGQEVVVAASRVEEKILESPVSIEKMGAAAVQATAGPSFYDALANMKGVEMSAQSLTFKSINTRGFNANGNERFNQFIDGMDNQAPGLNFSVGNIVGVSELDVQSVELLPGASSALYGSGGTNGTLLMTSKSPFTSQGLSYSAKLGMNHTDGYENDRSPLYEMNVRYAKAFNNKLAFKINASLLQATDWKAQDNRNIDRLTETMKSGDRNSDPNYDGVNVYGDEINANLKDVAKGMIAANVLPATISTPGGPVPTINFFPNQSVSRTGYQESDLVDFDTKSYKFSGALHYRLNSSVEAIAQANWGTGTSVYTGSDRYSLRNFSLGQYKLELKGSNFYLRGYTTQERSGEAYNATALASIINESWSPSAPDPERPSVAPWFPTYTGAFFQAKLAGKSDEDAFNIARATADKNRPAPGSETFNTLKDQITARTIGPAFGAKFNDKTNLYQTEGMYNFTEQVKFAELLTGASYKVYDLNSDGTIFDDAAQSIDIKEYGAFAQMGKKVLNDKLKLTAGIRYDKNENFKGSFTPRVSAVYTVANDHNFRVSYQTGFRNPTTQNQFIDLLIRANTRLIGGLPVILDKYNLRTNKGYTQASLIEFQKTGDPAVLQKYTFTEFSPESVKAYEIGYKGLINRKLLVDFYYYYNSYKNFISTLNLVQSSDGTPAGIATGKTFSTVVNNPAKVNSQGWALGLDYMISKYSIGGNVSFNELKGGQDALETSYNTPKVRYNLNFGSKEVFKNTGFNISYRWQDAFNWSSSFATGDVPAFGSVDAMVSYKVPSMKTMFKMGGSNIMNKYYRTSFGNPQMGGVYYVSILFDQFLK